MPLISHTHNLAVEVAIGRDLGVESLTKWPYATDVAVVASYNVPPMGPFQKLDQQSSAPTTELQAQLRQL